jgi:hypothetical protein
VAFCAYEEAASWKNKYVAEAVNEGGRRNIHIKEESI